jgi:hypothetical protein
MSDPGPVQQQLDAYNAHNVEDFLACYGDDVVVRHGDGRVLMADKDAMRAAYTELFVQQPDIRAEVANRLEAGSWVVDEEVVAAAGREIRALVAYELSDGLIRTAVMLTSDL